jgi:hypothetical protein
MGETVIDGSGTREPGDAGLVWGREHYDLVNDILVPLCLVGMLWCLARFLFDVRAVLVSGDTQVLRYVLFWFLIAVVGIAKIEALRGGRAVALPYKAGLALATGLFVLKITMVDALFGGGAGGQAKALLLNALAFAAIYWGGNAIHIMSSSGVVLEGNRVDPAKQGEGYLTDVRVIGASPGPAGDPH